MVAGTATLISFGDWTVPTDLMDARIPWDSYRDVWQSQVQMRPRAGQSAAIASATVGERRIVVDFQTQGTLNLAEFADELLEGLVPTDLTPKVLVVERPDGIRVQRSAVVEKPYGAPADTSLDTIRVGFVSADPIWRQTTVDRAGPVYSDYVHILDTPESLLVPVQGYAPVLPTIRISRQDNDPGANEYRQIRGFTLTNTGTKTWRKHPVLVPLGDTSTGWTDVPAGVQVEPPVALFLNGVSQRRQFVGFGLTVTYMWLVVDHLAPGKSLAYDLVNPLTLTGDTFSGKNAPAFDRSWWSGAAAAGGTTSTMEAGATTWEDNQWQRATVRILTGTGSGPTEYLVTSNDANTLTISGTWAGSTPNATSTYLVYHSSNTKWTYAVRQTERTGGSFTNHGTGTGLYWINKTQSKPDDFSSDVPGGWFPYSFLANRDDRNQETEGTGVNVGTFDYFGILDADRSWQGKTLKDSGNADGLMLSCPRAITQWRFDGLLKNPNGVAKGYFGSRSAGSLGWTTVREETTAADTLTHFGTTTFVLDSDSYQLVMALLPADGVEIPLSWSKDSGTATTGESGTATGGTTTTLTDTTKSWSTNQWVGYRALITAGTAAGRDSAISANTSTQLTLASGTAIDSTSQYVIVSRTVLDDATKEWATNQWVNGTVLITDGRGVGAKAVVTANTATKLTANFGVNTDATSRYQVTNKHLVATLRTDAFFYILLDDSTIGLSAISAPVSTNNALIVNVRNGGGSAVVPPYQRIRCGVGRSVFYSDAQEVVIDCAAKRAGVYTIATGALVREVTDAIVVEEVDASGNVVASPDWMKLSPGTHTFWVDNFSITGVNVVVETRPGFFS